MLDRAEPMTDQPTYPAPAKGQVLLIVDDDKAFRAAPCARDGKARLRHRDRGIRRRGARQGGRRNPSFAVVDMRLEDGNGLDVIEYHPQRGARKRAPSS